MADLGINLKIRVLTDATSGRAMASRRGLGKVRHIATHELWIQEHVLRGHIELVKVKNVFNSADMFTKYLDQAALNEAISQFNHCYMEGRSLAAPALNMIGGQELEMFLLGMMSRMCATGGRSYEEKPTVTISSVHTAPPTHKDEDARTTDDKRAALSCQDAGAALSCQDAKPNFWQKSQKANFWQPLLKAQTRTLENFWQRTATTGKNT